MLHPVAEEKAKAQGRKYLPTAAQLVDKRVEVRSQVALIGDVWSFHPILTYNRRPVLFPCHRKAARILPG